MNDLQSPLSVLFDPAEYGGGGPTEPAAAPEPPKISPAKLLRLLKEQGFRCAYSGRKLTPQTAGFVFHDGTPDDVRIVLKEVARMRAGLTYDEFADICRDVAGHAD